MTDENATPENGEWGEWGAGEPEAGGFVAPATIEAQLAPPSAYPANRPVRADHPLTLSFSAGRDAPMLVLRAETAAEMNALITQVEMAGLWANIGSHMSTMRAHGTLGSGMPGVQAAPQQPQPMQVTPQGIPMMPQAQMGPPLGAGGMPGTAPAQWQNAGAPQQPVAAQPGWFRVNIPYASKNVGDHIKQNLKNAGLYQGNMRWDGASKTWLVSPAIVAHFAQFNPTPA